MKLQLLTNPKASHGAGDEPRSLAVPADEITQQLSRMLASELFVQSPRLSRFLRFVVEQALQSPADGIKEYHLGVAVFDRDEGYDPRVDPIVRVEAGRLRSKLREYYETEGREDPVLIVLPKGSYLPAFAHKEQGSAVKVDDAATARVGRIPIPSLRTALIFLAVISVALAIFFFLQTRELKRQLSVSGSPIPRTEYSVLWEPFFTKGVPTYVVFGSPIFFASPQHNLFLRAHDINDARLIEGNAHLKSLTEILGPLTGPRYDYALACEMLALHRLSVFLTRAGVDVQAVPAYSATWEAIQNGNIVFLGPPRLNHLLQRFPRRLDFEWEADAIRNRNPAKGEQELYQSMSHEGFGKADWKDSRTYVVIARIPGLRPNREILLLGSHGGPGTIEAVEYVTRLETVRDFAQKLKPKSGTTPRSFEILLTTYVDRGMAVRTEYLTHHVHRQ